MVSEKGFFKGSVYHEQRKKKKVEISVNKKEEWYLKNRAGS